MKASLAGKDFFVVRFALVVGIIAGPVALSCAYADEGGVPAQIAALQQSVLMLRQQVGAQNTAITQLTAVVNSQSQLIGLLQQQNQDLQAKLGCMSKTGDDVYFAACNVHIISGSGGTEGAVNGLGNLIIGYNEDVAVLSPGSAASLRSGSHNLVVGPGHSYSSYGGAVIGRRSSIIAPFASVSGGYNNTASGESSSVSGGDHNTASGPFSSVSGGAESYASSFSSSVSGGKYSQASGTFSSVSGGWANQATFSASSVSGGIGNTASGDKSSVSGGQGNSASGFAASVSGGAGVTAIVDYSWAAGTLTYP